MSGTYPHPRCDAARRRLTVSELIILLNRYQNQGFEDAPVYVELWNEDSATWDANVINSVRRNINANDLSRKPLSDHFYPRTECSGLVTISAHPVTLRHRR